MTAVPADLRTVAAQVVTILRDNEAPLDQRVAQATSLLTDALTTTLPPAGPLSPAQRAALDSDPSVHAAIARLADDEEYVLADADGGPGSVPLVIEPGIDERPVDERRLAVLGL